MHPERIILDLCGGSGAWSKPYKDAGYTVHVITLPDYSVADWWHLLNGNLRFRLNSPKKDGMSFLEVPIGTIYGILAAPPCTQFSIARTRAKIPRDLTGGLQTVNACMDIIHHVQAYGKLQFWALENPRGLLRRFLGRPPLTFMQWQYGDGRDKPTDLWGFYNTPRPTSTIRPTDIKDWGGERVKDGYDRAAVRAMTPEGFARAFYKANHTKDKL